MTTQFSTPESTAQISARVRVVAVIDLRDASPRELRERFARVLRDAVQRARTKGHIDSGQADELIRVLPAEGQA